MKIFLAHKPLTSGENVALPELPLPGDRAMESRGNEEGRGGEGRSEEGRGEEGRMVVRVKVLKGGREEEIEVSGLCIKRRWN